MKVLIAGMGLIGGSFALALRDRGIADEILGTDSSEENAAEALRLGLADRIVAFEEGIPQADLVVLATPVDTIPLMAVKALNRVNGRKIFNKQRRQTHSVSARFVVNYFISLSQFARIFKRHDTVVFHAGIPADNLFAYCFFRQ